MINLVEALANLLIDYLDLRLNTGLFVIRIAVRGVVTGRSIIYRVAHFSHVFLFLNKE
jgi:hypothetical protein